MKNFYPRNLNQTRETLFHEQDPFSIEYTSEQQLFESLAKFEFESFCVREGTFKDTNTTSWIEKLVQILYPFPQILFMKHFSFATPILTTSLHPLLDLSNFWLTEQNSYQILVSGYRENKKIELGKILEKLDQSHDYGNKPVWMIVTINAVLLLSSYRYKESVDSTARTFGTICYNVLHVLGFNSAK